MMQDLEGVYGYVGGGAECEEKCLVIWKQIGQYKCTYALKLFMHSIYYISGIVNKIIIIIIMMSWTKFGK